MQVSWLRGSDSQVLSSGFAKFTGDRRVKVIPADRSHSWGLSIRNVTPSDSGRYLCQVNTEPKISLAFDVLIADTFASIPGSHERYVQAGSKLELTCKISKKVWPGETPPEVMWLLEGVKVKGRDENDGGGGIFWGGGGSDKGPRISPVSYNEVNLKFLCIFR